MNEPTPVTKFKAMAEAGFHYPEPWANYSRCVDLLKKIAKHNRCICCKPCYPCEAQQVLIRIGEECPSSTP